MPFCERNVTVPRRNLSPVWRRSFPVSKQPQTIGEHLRKKRVELGLRQSEAALRLNVSARTLSLWECDEVYPTWAQQPKIIAYLDHNPFTDPALGKPKSNETHHVAFLALETPSTIGEQILKRRLEQRKTRKDCAEELGVTAKTFLDWETNRRQPTAVLQKRINEFLRRKQAMAGAHRPGPGSPAAQQSPSGL